MAHAEQMFFVNSIRSNLPSYFQSKRVLELGSLNINGTVRDFFNDCDYLGIDVGDGPGVDLVCRGENYPGNAKSFDVVISCEMMEHNPDWRETFLNMMRLIRGDGLMVISCATVGRRQHGTTSYTPFDSPLTVSGGQDYYRNLTESDFSGIINLSSIFAVHSFFTDHASHDLYFMGIGCNAESAVKKRAEALIVALNEFYFKKNILGIR
jgi:SAM-dependent methyltransferase